MTFHGAQAPLREARIPEADLARLESRGWLGTCLVRALLHGATDLLFEARPDGSKASMRILGTKLPVPGWDGAPLDTAAAHRALAAIFPGLPPTGAPFPSWTACVHTLPLGFHDLPLRMQSMPVEPEGFLIAIRLLGPRFNHRRFADFELDQLASSGAPPAGHPATRRQPL